MAPSRNYKCGIIRWLDENVSQEVKNLLLLVSKLSDKEAKGYWKGLKELTEWVKVTVEPVHIASFDYSKDSKYLDATKKYTS